MIRTAFVVPMLLLAALATMPQAATTVSPVLTAANPEHGGGCRKSSPPGQCCHLETATGVVHCH